MVIPKYPSPQEDQMILVRNVFQIKYGRAKEATAAWKDGMALFRRLAPGSSETRLLTDLVGTYYTLIFESGYESLADYETTMHRLMENADWRSWYPTVTELIEGGKREIFTVVE